MAGINVNGVRPLLSMIYERSETMNTAAAEAIISSPAPMSWTIIAVLVMLALVLILGALDKEQENHGSRKDSNKWADSDQWGPLE